MYAPYVEDENSRIADEQNVLLISSNIFKKISLPGVLSLLL